MNNTQYQIVKETIRNKADLCVVTKKRTREEILTFYDSGERVFGENHAQELLSKCDLPSDIRWQFIGHLQRNKVRSILPYVDCIQSLDSLELARVIEKEASRIHRVVKCYMEVHLAVNDTRKTGIEPELALAFQKDCEQFPHICLCGMMVMGPHTDDIAEIQRVFTQAHDLFETLKKNDPTQRFQVLSMGMSRDYRIAVECGSNMVRIGTSLFSE